jgi:hypothetical protein
MHQSSDLDILQSVTSSPSLTPRNDPELRRGLLTDLHEAFTQVSGSDTGQIVFCVGQHGCGRTTLLAQLAAELSAAHRRPNLIAGGFGGGGAYKGLQAWRLPSRRLDLLTRADGAASGLGQLVATAAAGAAVNASADSAQTFASIANFVGQAGQAVGYAAARSTDSHPSGAPPTDVPATALLHAVRSMLRTGDPLVLILDDLDQAQPAPEWCNLFIERWITPILRDAPLLVVAAVLDEHHAVDAVSAASSRAYDLACSPTGSMRLDPAQATTVRIGPLTADDIEAWLDPIDPAVRGDLLACAGGHPGWTVELLSEWNRCGLVRRGENGTLRYSSDDLQSRAKTAEAYVQTLLWDIVGHDVEAYDRSERILHLAAIEGTTFTTEAVAKVLGENDDETIDWIDDRLCQADDEARSPLVEVGFTFLPSGARAPRHLTLYAFRSPLWWAAMHPPHSADPHDSPDWGEKRQTAEDYAGALAEVYGRQPSTPFHRIASLYRWAGNPYAAAHYQHLGDLTADLDVHREILKAELDSVRDRRGDEWQPARTLSSATRIILACVGLQEALDDKLLVNSLLQGYEMTEEVAAADPQLDVQILQAHVLKTMANVAYHREWFGDAIASASGARILWLGFPDPYEVVHATIHCISSYGRLLQALRKGDVKALSPLVRHQVPLPLAPVLPPGDPEIWDEESVVAAMLSKEADRLAESATDEISQVPLGGRDHAKGNLCLARSDLALGEGDLEGAAALLQLGAENFSTCPFGELCPRLGEACARLVGVLWRQEDYQGAEGAARRALYVLLSHASWSRAAEVQLDVSQAHMAAEDREGAATAAAYGIYICRKGELQALESMLWAQVAAFLVTERQHDPRIVLECQSMSKLRSQDRNENFLTDLPTRLRGQRHHDQSTLDRYLDKARAQWDLDQGANLLQRASATSEADAEAFFAELAQVPPSHGG